MEEEPGVGKRTKSRSPPGRETPPGPESYCPPYLRLSWTLVPSAERRGAVLPIVGICLFGAGDGGRGARAGLCQLQIAAGADPPQALTALGGARQTAARAMPASNCSPSNFPCPWEPGSTKKFHQLKCCAPEHLPNARHPRKVRGLQTPLLGGKDIYKQAFSSPLPSLVDGLQTEVFGKGGLPEGLGEISLFEDQRHMAACATSVLHGMLETLSPSL